MGYMDIFEQLVATIHHEYAGKLHKKGWDKPDFYKRQIAQMQSADALTRESFSRIARSYLLDLKDHHVSFRDYGEAAKKGLGFRVKRCGDDLFVTRLLGSDQVAHGERITAVDGQAVQTYADRHGDLLKLQPPHRQDWTAPLKAASTITVHGVDGRKRTVQLLPVAEADPYGPDYTCKWLDKETGYLRLNIFIHPKELAACLKDGEDILSTCKYLVVDIRGNEGGNDELGHPVLEYMIGEGQEQDVSYQPVFVWTENNSAQMMAAMKKYEELPESKAFMAILRKWDVPGVHTFDRGPVVLKGRKGPAHTVVLIDERTGSSGESFAIQASKLPTVTLMGRNSMGMLDYANCVSTDLGDDFAVGYPICYNPGLWNGGPIDFVGITPDIHIPWTPGHLRRDVDVDRAVAYLKHK